MRVLIISDTHRRDIGVEELYREVGRPDLLIHLGDVMGREDYIEALFDCPCYFVAGNNDRLSRLPDEIVVTIGKHRVLMVHGHRHNPYWKLDGLRNYAVRKKADIVMFGHTHMPEFDDSEDITVLNPGSLSLPRQLNHKPTYAIMDVDEEGEVEYKFYYLGGERIKW